MKCHLLMILQYKNYHFWTFWAYYTCRELFLKNSYVILTFAFNDSKITLSELRFGYLYHSACCWQNRNWCFQDICETFLFVQSGGKIDQTYWVFSSSLCEKIRCLDVFQDTAVHWVNSGGQGDRRGATGKGGGIILISTHTAPSLHLRCRNGVFQMWKWDEKK